MPMAAAISAGGGIAASAIGAGAQVYNQNNAIGAYSSAQNNAINAQNSLFNRGLDVAGNYATTGYNALNPWASAGFNALGKYQNELPFLTTPFNAGMLESTPGYQFTLDQGLKTTQNSNAALGLATSGSAMKGAASYATGLAQSTYNQQLQNYLAQNAQIANLLYQPVATGAGAAGGIASLTGQFGTGALSAATQTGAGIAGSYANAGNQIGGAFTGIGNAIAGGATGASNALTSGIQYSLLAPYIQALTQRAGAAPAAAWPGSAYSTNALATSGAPTGAGGLSYGAGGALAYPNIGGLNYYG